MKEGRRINKNRYHERKIKPEEEGKSGSSDGSSQEASGVRACVLICTYQVGTYTKGISLWWTLWRQMPYYVEAHIQCHGRLPPTAVIITPYTQSSLLCVIIYIQQMNAVVTGNYDMVRDPPPFFHAGFRSYGFLLEIEFICPALLLMAGLNNMGRQDILAFTSCSVSFFFA